MAVDSKELHDGEMLILDKTGNTIGAYGTCFDWRCGMLQKNAFSN
ncbi:MAG: hypothetical protein SPL56_07575 [Lachnospiraceae bacterium]|nr:hypothetical protein [Lachnospiraceae bacterium]